MTSSARAIRRLMGCEWNRHLLSTLADLGRTHEARWRETMLRLIAIVRSWHVLIRIGIATSAVAVATALQLPGKIEVPGEPFLLNFIVVVTSSICLGRTVGFLAAAETGIASALHFEPVYSFK